MNINITFLLKSILLVKVTTRKKSKKSPCESDKEKKNSILFSPFESNMEKKIINFFYSLSRKII